MFAYRILLVDEDPTYRWDLKQGLELDPGLRVVAEAGNGHQALALAESQRPDLVLIGRRLPGLNGLEVGAAIRCHHVRTRVLVVAPVVDYDQCLAAVRAGAAGIVPRYGDQQRLRTTVRTVLAGADFVQPWTGCEGLSVPAPLDQPLDHDLAGTLTTRELEALDCLLMGMSTKETAAALGIADQTVKNRISSVLHKLRLDGRMGAIRLALTRGWAEYGPASHVDPVSVPVAEPSSQPSTAGWTPTFGLEVPPTMLTAPGEHAQWA
jgi:DNA-binding NarL/FixJ family response regulator